MHTKLSSSNQSVINLVFVTLHTSTESQLSAKPKPVVEDEEDEEEDNSSDEEGMWSGVPMGVSGRNL